MTVILKLKEDGKVWKHHQCDCGNKMYQKNMETGELVFLVKRDKAGGYSKQHIQPVGNGAVIKVKCTNCNLGHIIADVRENMISYEEYEFDKN